MDEQDIIPDVRAIRLGGGVRGDEVSLATGLVFAWTSLVTVTLTFEVVFGVRAALSLVQRGDPPVGIALAALLAVLPIPGVFVYASVWWNSLRAPGTRSGRALSPIVPLSLVAGALAGLVLG